MSLIAELKRRKVFKVGAAYLIVAWLAIQAASIGFPAFDAPPWALRVFILVALLGFPIAVVMAWVFETTDAGVTLDANLNGSKRVFAAAAILIVLALGWYFKGQPAFRKSDVAAPATATTANAKAAVDAHSIAVLPFVNMSSDKDEDYFSDGLSEQLLNQLAQSPQLKVIARTSSFSFKGKQVDIATIARALNVANVLEGSVRKSGNTLRITAQLIRTSDSTHLWSQTYDRELTDIFKVQDEISDAIAGALEAKIGNRPAGDAPVASVDPAAYDDYLQGRALVFKRVGDNTRLAVEAFDRSIAKDPSYSAAHSARAFALTIGTYWGNWLPRDQAFAQAQASIETALRLDPGNAEAYMVRGIIAATSLHTVAGKADLDRALALAPGNVDVINFYGDVLGSTGDPRGAEAMKRKAMTLDPLAFIHPVNLSQALTAQGRLAEALQSAQLGQALADAIGAHRVWGNVFWSQIRIGRTQDAQRNFDANCAKPLPDEVELCRTLRIPLLAALGRTPEAEKELASIAADVHAGKALVRFGGVSGPLGLAALYVQSLQDPHRAAAEILASLEHVQWFGYDKLLLTPKGEASPEEISTDPDWLAAWNDPRLHEYMTVYRANLAKFRKGG